jgi:hypothetical protein
MLSRRGKRPPLSPVSPTRRRNPGAQTPQTLTALEAGTFSRPYGQPYRRTVCFKQEGRVVLMLRYAPTT